MAVESEEMVFSVISNLAQPFDDEEIAMNITYFASGPQFKISLGIDFDPYDCIDVVVICNKLSFQCWCTKSAF
jgi:hypothetical protein